MSEKNKKIKKTVIIAGYECNNNCVFCININKRNLVKKSTGEIKKEISHCIANNNQYAYLSAPSQILYYIDFNSFLKNCIEQIDFNHGTIEEYKTEIQNIIAIYEFVEKENFTIEVITKVKFLMRNLMKF